MSGNTRITLAAAVATLLAATSLVPLYQDLAWFGPALVAVALVALAGWVVRRLRLPAFAEPVLAAVLVLDWVTLWFAPKHAHAGVVPGRQTFDDLHALLSRAGTDIHDLAAPIPTHDGVTLVAVLAVAGVALLVDLLAVTARRPALAGAPYLAMFAVSSAIAPHGVGWLPFLLTGAGWLVLLLADNDDKLARWGRRLDPNARDRRAAGEYADTSPLGAAGRRIGAAALGAAVVLPALVPGLHGLAIGNGTAGTGSGHGGSITTFNPLLRISDQLHQTAEAPLIRVRADSDPGYIRLTALDKFDGNTWSSSLLTAGPGARVKGKQLLPRGITVPTQGQQVRLTVGNLAVHWLPMPYPASQVTVGGDWRFDTASGTVFSSRDDTRDLKYTVVAEQLLPLAEDLRDATAPPASLDPFLALPSSLPSEVARTAARVTAGATNPYDRAVALQNWLRSPPFVYDDTVGGADGQDAIVQFLRNHRGFCVQYAATMAVMARVLHIPARVAVGFTSGQRQADGSWLVTTKDAHAWPELYFAGAGWLRFEPTPRAGAGVAPPTYTLPGANDPTTATPGSVPTPAPSASTDALKNLQLDKLNRLSGIGAPGGGGAAAKTEHHLPWKLIVVLCLLVVLAALPGAGRELTRRRRWSLTGRGRGRVHAAWAELRDDALDLGLPWQPSDSPRGAGRRIAGVAVLTPTTAAALDRVVRAEERARYAAAAPDVAPGALRHDVATVRAGLAATLPWPRRVRARLLPGSTLRRAGTTTVDLVAGLFEAMDAAGPWLRTRVGRALPRRASRRA